MGSAVSAVDVMARRGMPEPVREARQAAWGLAGVGVAYPVVLGLTLGGVAAEGAMARFFVSWILGATVFAFAGGGDGVRRVAAALASLQAVVGFVVHADAIPPLLGLVPSVYSLGIAIAIVYLLSRAESRVWFGGHS
jgi:hypothetical protein